MLITNLASYTVSNILTSQLLQNLSSLNNNSKRAVFASRAAAQVQKLVAHADTSLGHPRFDLAEGVGFAREKLRQAVLEVEALHKLLYLEAEASGNQQWFAQYHEPSWTARTAHQPRPPPTSTTRPFTLAQPGVNSNSNRSWTSCRTRTWTATTSPSWNAT